MVGGGVQVGLIGVGAGARVEGGVLGVCGMLGDDGEIVMQAHPALSVSERIRIREITKYFTFVLFITDYILALGRSLEKNYES